MMQTLRKNMRHILTVVLVAFVATIIFSWGMGGFKDRGAGTQQGIIGKVNGYPITYQNFAASLDQEISVARERSGQDDLSDYQLNMLRDRVWQNMLRDVLLAQEVDRLNIQPSAEEIVFFMRNSPPEFIQNSEQFQTEGEFDMAKYQEALRNPAYYDAWLPLENYYRNLLPMQKLQQWVLSTVRVTDEEAKAALTLENERVNVEYVLFDPNTVSLEGIETNEKEIKVYYDEHKEDYLNPEQRQIKYVAFDLVPTSQDTQQTVEDIEYLLEELNNGADFAELAKEHSQDGSAANGGDLGFFGKGSMVKPFEDAAFAAKVGEIVGPVRTQFGVHLIKVIARKQEKGETQVQASHILIKYEMSLDTRERKYDSAQFLYEALENAKEQDISQIAEGEGYVVSETPAFTEGGFIPTLGMATRANYLAFKEDIGWFSKPVTTGNKVIVFQISAIEKMYYKPIDEVRDHIVRELERDKKKVKAGELCKNAWDAVQSSASLQDVVIQDSLKIDETGFFSLASHIPVVGQDAAFAGTAFKLQQDHISEPVEGVRGYYLIRLLEKTAYSPDDMETAIVEKKQTLLQEKKNTLYMAWYNDLKDNAKIEDFRKEFF